MSVVSAFGGGEQRRAGGTGFLTAADRDAVISIAILEEGVAAGLVGMRVNDYIVVHRHREIGPQISIGILAGALRRVLVIAPHVFFKRCV